jgi:hypothetical protein
LAYVGSTLSTYSFSARWNASCSSNALFNRLKHKRSQERCLNWKVWQTTNRGRNRLERSRSWSVSKYYPRIWLGRLR